EAERIKTLCGTIMCARSDENVSIPYWRSDESGFVAYQSQQGEQQETTRAELTRILAPRARHQLELVREHLERSHVAREMAQSIVLTGGASQLVGFQNLAAEVFSKPVRVGPPKLVAGMAEDLNGPAMSTVVGLGLADATPVHRAHQHQVRASKSYLSRMEQWLRESF
ncbi:MAG: cell division FtsA domain-containing protein, partial [Hyphomicrobiaceae bacterium]